MRDRTQISASNLGLLAFEEACRRCFWLMLIIGSKFPYRLPFPGVMFRLDKLEKNLVEAALEHNGAAPAWMGGLSKAESALPEQSLRHEHESGMTLTGKPDAVFEMPDGTLGLVDYKTAAFKGEDDPLFVKYAVQLGVYALLLEKTYAKKVSKSGLVYFQAENGAEGAALLPQLTDSGFSVEFSAHWLSVKVDHDQVSNLLSEAYELATTGEPPEAGDGCKHCANLLRITELLDGIKQPLVDVRQLRFLTTQERMQLCGEMKHRKYKLETAVKDMLNTLEDVRHDDPRSVIGQWDLADGA